MFVLYCSNIKTPFCCCCFFGEGGGHQTLYGTNFNTTTPDPTQHATPHSSSPTTTSKVSLAFHVPRFKPSRTHLGVVGQTCPRQSERPLQTCASCSRHSSRSGWSSQRKWFTSWSGPCQKDAGQWLILVDRIAFVDLRVPRSQNTD